MLLALAKAPGSAADHETALSTNQSSGQMIQPHRMPNCMEIVPATQSAVPSTSIATSRGTVSRFVSGAINETWLKVTPMMGKVAIWAARVTAIISVR